MARKLDLSNASQFKRAIGRTGIGVGDNGALFGLSSRMRYREIPLASVAPDPGQPRRNARAADIEVLAASIDQKGLLQPINVREIEPDRFVIVAGERRYWAFRQLERETIPALILDTDDGQALALIENVQRLDLHPVELAVSLGRLIDDKGLVQEQAAVLIGKSQEYVARLLGILRLPARILEEAPEVPEVSVSLLMELAEIGDEATQLALWTQAGAGLTVKTVRAAKQPRPARTAATPSFDPILRALSTGLTRMHSLTAGGRPLEDDHRRALREARAQIDALLGDRPLLDV
jgi:ParB family chromosome partitioning protein